MLRRIFWLVLAAIAAWLIWMRLRQYRDEFAASHPAPALSAPTGEDAQQPVLLGARQEPAPAPGETADIRLAAETAELDGAPEGDISAAEEPAIVETYPFAAAGAITNANENKRATAEASSVAVPEDTDPLDEEVVGYCVRCKTKRPIKDAHEERTESGRRAARGVCPVCGANMFTFLATSDEGAAQ
jgi:Domain of unknown function (DUF5679)